MDKKNTMLLTVIAVATLLVAVVGATFAYFAVNENAGSAQTTVTATTKKIPAIKVNQKAQTIGIELSATDMNKDPEADIKYYAPASGNTPIKGTQTDIELATISADGGESTDNYECDVTLTVTVDDASTMLTGEKGLGTGNANLILTGDLFTETIDLTKGTTTKEATLTIKGATDTPKSIKAALEIINSHTTDQSNAAGKTLTVTVKTEATNCHLQTAGD